jgi:hypothetical protein
MQHTGSHGNTIDGAEFSTWEAAALTDWKKELVTGFGLGLGFGFGIGFGFGFGFGC